MFPIFWTYLIKRYMKVLVLSTLAFVSVLLITRLEEIAKFASISPSATKVFFFVLYQVPYILPIAIPISCLIASFLLFQDLSRSSELTAFRATGFGLRKIALPIVLCSLFLSLFSFYVVSELATSAHLHSKRFKSEIKKLNPLTLIQNSEIFPFKDIQVDIYGPWEAGEYAEDVFISFLNHHSGRLSLLFIDKISAQKGKIYGKNLSLIGSLRSESKNTESPPLFIENIKRFDNEMNIINDSFIQNNWTLKNDQLNLRLLLLKLRLITEKKSPQLVWKQHDVQEILSEIVRRVSIALASTTFTIMGLSFAIEIGRTQSKKNIAYSFLLTCFFLFSFFSAKGNENNINLALSLYLLAHLLILTLSFRRISRLNTGHKS